MKQVNKVSVSVNEMAICLGISPRSAWRLVRDGTVSSYVLGRRVLVKYQDLVDLVEQRASRAGDLAMPKLSEAITKRNKARAKKTVDTIEAKTSSGGSIWIDL